MRDVVYIVGNGSRWGNNELRYSMRSIEKYGIGLGRVFLVGTIPSFINRAHVTCIPMGDETNYPAKNVYRKIKAAIECEDVADEFLISSDDHFFVRPTDFVNYPLYYKSHQLPKRSDVGTGKFGGAQYTRGMANTRDVMEAHSMGCMYFEGHTNKLYSKEAWHVLEQMGVWKCMDEYEDGFSTNSPMATMIARLHPFGVDVKHRKDIKIHKYASFDELEEILKDTDSFSIGDSAIECGMDQYLQWLFPEKSKYEK